MYSFMWLSATFVQNRNPAPFWYGWIRGARIVKANPCYFNKDLYHGFQNFVISKRHHVMWQTSATTYLVLSLTYLNTFTLWKYRCKGRGMSLHSMPFIVALCATWTFWTSSDRSGTRVFLHSNGTTTSVPTLLSMFWTHFITMTS